MLIQLCISFMHWYLHFWLDSVLSAGSSLYLDHFKKNSRALSSSLHLLESSVTPLRSSVQNLATLWVESVQRSRPFLLFLCCCLHSHSLSVKTTQCYMGYDWYIACRCVLSNKWYYIEALSSFLKSLKHFKCSTKHQLKNNIFLEIHRKQYIKTTNKKVHSCNTAHSYTLSVLCPIQFNKIKNKRGRIMCRIGHSVQGAHGKCSWVFFFLLLFLL